MIFKKYLLISDLDGTLIGDEASLEFFAEWFQSRNDFLGLVYATGRFFDSVVEAVETTALPEPEAIIGFVGTDIYDYPSGAVMEAWHSKIDKNWDAEVIRGLLSSRRDLELQPEEFQSAFKVSYYLHDASPEEILSLQKEIQRASVETEVIYSSNRDLDFLPLRANKGKAAMFLASTWAIAGNRVLVAGDSGNDRALFEQGFRGIIVGNAHPELKQLKGPGIYHAHRCFADGVLEGIKYWWDML